MYCLDNNDRHVKIRGIMGRERSWNFHFVIVTGKVMKNYWYMFTSLNRKWEIYTYFMTVTLIGPVKLLSLGRREVLWNCLEGYSFPRLLLYWKITDDISLTSLGIIWSTHHLINLKNRKIKRYMKWNLLNHYSTVIASLDTVNEIIWNKKPKLHFIIKG